MDALIPHWVVSVLVHPAWWVTASLMAVDVIIRLVALGTIPYRRKPTAALAWLILIFLVPFVGLFAFFVFGTSKLPRRRREKQEEVSALVKERTDGEAILGSREGLGDEIITSAQLNYELGALPLVHGSGFELVRDNHECIAEMAEAVSQAQRYVHVEFYIVALDPITRPFFDALIAAHRRGVSVHVLIDHIGSVGYPGYGELVGLLDSAGIPWRRSLPIRPWRREYQRPDLRNHRKILIVDGEIGFTGSQNLIHRSYNKRSNLRRGLEWKDLMIRCTGPVVSELNVLFATDWYAETGEILLAEFDEAIDPPESGGVLSQVVPSGPGFEAENNLRLFNHLIYNANHTVVICSPYFVPDSSLLSALKTESQSGVDVRLYVGATNDHLIAGLAQASYYDELVDAGVTIRQYHAPTVLHAKFILIDDEVTIIGSSNMDERSFAMNLEVSTLIVDRDFTARMYALEREDFAANSVDLDVEAWHRRGWRRKYAENVCRLASALL